MVCMSSERVTCVAFDPKNPNIIVSCSWDYTIKMWDITSGLCLSMSCDSPVWCFDFKDNMIAAGCENGQIKIFKLNESQDWAEFQSEPFLWIYRYDTTPLYDCPVCSHFTAKCFHAVTLNHAD